MKIEDAIKELENAIEDCTSGEDECFRQALGMGIVALREDIPRPPQKFGKDYYCECGVMFLAWDRPGCQTNYCGNCGQRLK